MSKELVISSNRHETRVAILEDDQLVEIYFQRANEYSLAGSIHKGRVSRVLPGMQAAFVDIGLDRDAFLYVADVYLPSEAAETVEGTLPGVLASTLGADDDLEHEPNLHDDDTLSGESHRPPYGAEPTIDSLLKVGQEL